MFRLLSGSVPYQGSTARKRGAIKWVCDPYKFRKELDKILKLSSDLVLESPILDQGNAVKYIAEFPEKDQEKAKELIGNISLKVAELELSYTNPDKTVDEIVQLLNRSMRGLSSVLRMWGCTNQYVDIIEPELWKVTYMVNNEKMYLPFNFDLEAYVGYERVFYNPMMYYITKKLRVDPDIMGYRDGIPCLVKIGNADISNVMYNEGYQIETAERKNYIRCPDMEKSKKIMKSIGGIIYGYDDVNKILVVKNAGSDWFRAQNFNEKVHYFSYPFINLEKIISREELIARLTYMFNTNNLDLDINVNEDTTIKLTFTQCDELDQYYIYIHENDRKYNSLIISICEAEPSGNTVNSQCIKVDDVYYQVQESD